MRPILQLWWERAFRVVQLFERYISVREPLSSRDRDTTVHLFVPQLGATITPGDSAIPRLRISYEVAFILRLVGMALDYPSCVAVASVMVGRRRVD